MVKFYNYINLDIESYPMSGKPVIIWGRSFAGLRAILEVQARGGKILGITDSFVESETDMFAGYPVVPVKKFKERPEIICFLAGMSSSNTVTVLNRLESEGIQNTIVAHGIFYGPGAYDTGRLSEMIERDKEMIASLKSSLSDEQSVHTFDNLLEYRQTNRKELISEVFERGHLQYFAPEIVHCTKNEVFIDAGGYDGNTSYRFAEYVGHAYNKIFILEPDQVMAGITSENIKLLGLSNTTVVNKGLYSRSATLHFQNDAENASSKIDAKGESVIETISCDELLSGNMATFIKMDIEGAEREALLGADKTIRQYHPKLAISIYHLEDDLWKIPYSIHEKYPWYKLYIRHYTDITVETVLYAVE